MTSMADAPFPERTPGVESDLDAYREYLIGLGLKPKTVSAYYNKLRRSLEWATENGSDLCDLMPSEAVRLSSQWPNRHSSQRHLRSALLHFWELHGVTGPAAAIRVPPKPTSQWRGLEDEQVRALLKVSQGDWPKGGLVYLGIYLGLRREEITTLRWTDFDPTLEWATIIGKQDRIRRLPVHPKLRHLLHGVQRTGDWVFPGRLGGHVSLTTINNWMADISDRAGLGHVYPHQLRHTSGGKINDVTRDIYVAQAWLGHARVETTQVYTRLKSERLVAAMVALAGERLG